MEGGINIYTSKQTILSLVRVSTCYTSYQIILLGKKAVRKLG